MVGAGRRKDGEGRRGKDIVVLDRWGEDRTEDAVSSLARSRSVSVSRCNRVSALLRKLQLLARRDEAILSGRPAAEVERREILLEGLIDMGSRAYTTASRPTRSTF